MKKIQRSFAVEHKHGRRKVSPKPHSIWGNIDLKSVTQDVEDETMPLVPQKPRDVTFVKDLSLHDAEQTAPVLTLPIERQTTVSAIQESSMDDVTDSSVETADPAVTAAATPAVKTRKPRTKKSLAEATSTEDTAQSAEASNAVVAKPKRGRKPKSEGGTANAKRITVKRSPRASQPETGPAVLALDEMTDLLQLEDENQRLRKLLAEKLRAENADLRKRLNLD